MIQWLPHLILKGVSNLPSKKKSRIRYKWAQPETLYTPLPKAVNKYKRPLVDENKLWSRFSLSGMREFSVRDPIAPGQSLFYPIQYLSAQRKLHVLQQHFWEVWPSHCLVGVYKSQILELAALETHALVCYLHYSSKKQRKTIHSTSENFQVK